jgi:hypothetical protein
MPGIDQGLSAMVKNNPPGRANIKDPDAVVFRHFFKIGGFENLQIPEAADQTKEDQQDGNRCYPELPLKIGRFFFFEQGDRGHQINEGFFPKKVLKR